MIFLGKQTNIEYAYAKSMEQSVRTRKFHELIFHFISKVMVDPMSCSDLGSC